MLHRELVDIWYSNCMYYHVVITEDYEPSIIAKLCLYKPYYKAREFASYSGLMWYELPEFEPIVNDATLIKFLREQHTKFKTENSLK